MASEKENKPVLASVLFLISAIVLALNIFKIPANAGVEYSIDKLFYYSLNIIFWFTLPNILGFIVRKIIWQSEYKESLGARSVGIIEDVVIVFIYTASLGILIIKLFGIEITPGFILIFIIVMVLAYYTRPKLLKLSKEGYVHSARPFKVGDWISLLSEASGEITKGKVIGFSGKSLQLRSEENTLVVIPHFLLTSFIIENYQALEREINFGMEISLSRQIPIERAKRILKAAVKHALIKAGENSQTRPVINIKSLNKDSIDYKIIFTFAPWVNYSPDRMKDLIYTTIDEHLETAGIKFEPDKEPNLISRIELFAGLSRAEVDELNSSAAQSICREGSTIIRNGDEGSSMFILTEGLLNVFIKAGESGEIKAGVIAPGEFFGEMSLFTGEKRSATIKAETDSVIIEITKEAMKKIVDKKPALINGFGEIIAERQSSNLKLRDEYLNRKESFVQKLVAGIKSFFNN